LHSWQDFFSALLATSGQFLCGSVPSPYQA
jgi:hypothetical protein